MKKHDLLIAAVIVISIVVLAACSSDEPDSVEEVVKSEVSQQEAADQPADEPSGQEGSVEKNIQVGPFMVDCEGEGPQQCMLVREHEMDPWQLYYTGIEGFEYEQGFLYDLLVVEQNVENPPAGGTSLKWVLKEETARTPIAFTNMIVGPERVECEGEGPQECYLVKYNPNEDWQYFYSEIQGFNYEPGYTYELVVAEIPVKNPPAGASSIQYLLYEIGNKSEAELPETEGVDLDGTIWAAATINGQPVLEGSEVLMGIAPGRIGGIAGCNTYF
ncbi:MAG: DUF4377 domain-containing protein, partial [Candidatus Promineifilaceae bacterium]